MQPVKQGVHQVETRRVKLSVGLVDQSQPWALRQQPGKGQALAHPRRVGPDRIRSCVQVDGLQQATNRLHVPPAQHAKGQGQVLRATQVLVEPGLVAEKSKVLADLKAIADRVQPQDTQASPAGSPQSRDRAQERGLARPIRPHDQHPASFGHRQVHASQGPTTPEATPKVASLDGQGGHAGLLTPPALLAQAACLSSLRFSRSRSSLPRCLSSPSVPTHSLRVPRSRSVQSWVTPQLHSWSGPMWWS